MYGHSTPDCNRVRQRPLAALPDHTVAALQNDLLLIGSVDAVGLGPQNNLLPIAGVGLGMIGPGGVRKVPLRDKDVPLPVDAVDLRGLGPGVAVDLDAVVQQFPAVPAHLEEFDDHLVAHLVVAADEVGLPRRVIQKTAGSEGFLPWLASIRCGSVHGPRMSGALDI